MQPHAAPRPIEPSPIGGLTMARVRQARLCRAHRRDGAACSAYAVIGAEVCRAHGGVSPPARRGAERRIAGADLRRAVEATSARYMREVRRWQATRVAVASELLGLPVEDFFLPGGEVNEALIAWCRLEHGRPNIPAPTLRLDRRFAAVRALEAGDPITVDWLDGEDE
jgi:hypothetical protein